MHYEPANPNDDPPSLTYAGGAGLLIILVVAIIGLMTQWAPGAAWSLKPLDSLTEDSQERVLTCESAGQTCRWLFAQAPDAGISFRSPNGPPIVFKACETDVICVTTKLYTDVDSVTIYSDQNTLYLSEPDRTIETLSQPQLVCLMKGMWVATLETSCRQARGNNYDTSKWDCGETLRTQYDACKSVLRTPK